MSTNDNVRPVFRCRLIHVVRVLYCNRSVIVAWGWGRYTGCSVQAPRAARSASFPILYSLAVYSLQTVLSTVHSLSDHSSEYRIQY